jgi:hypothetical protein
MNLTFLIHDPRLLVRSNKDTTVLTAAEVHLEDDLISWEDQNGHERIFTIEDILESTRQRFSFIRHKEEGGGIYTLTPLTQVDEERYIKPSLFALET